MHWLWLGTEADRQFLVFEFDAFNPEISLFPFTIPDVPLLMYQCLTWLESNVVPIKPITTQTNSTMHTFRTSDHVKIDLQTQEESAIQVQKPDGRTIELKEHVFTENRSNRSLLLSLRGIPYMDGSSLIY